MGLDETYTDLEFKQRIDAAERDWMGQFGRREPDLKVEALTSSLLSRLINLFSK